MKQNRGLTVWTTAIPLFFELIAISSIALIDILFMSLVSDQAVAALGVSTQVLMVFTLLIRTLSGGAGAIAGQSLGAGDQERAQLAFMYTVVISVVFGAFFSLFLFFGRVSIGQWMGLGGETLDITQRYLAIVGPAFFLLAVRSGYSAVVAVKGKTKINLYCSLVANVVNIFLNCVFVLGWFGLPKMGVEGVALAAAIAYAVQLILLAWVSHKYLHVHFIFPRDILKRMQRLTGPVMGIAIPSSGDLLSNSLYQVAIMMMVIRIGDEAVACYTYLRLILTVVVIWSYAIGQGQSIWTAHLVGGKEFDKAESEIKKSILRSLAFSVPVTFLLYIFSGPIVGMFTDDVTIIAMASTAMIAYLGIEVGRAFNATLSFSLSSAGHAKYPALLGFSFNWLVGLTVAYILGVQWQWGLLGVLIGLALDELLRAPLLYRRLVSKLWCVGG